MRGQIWTRRGPRGPPVRVESPGENWANGPAAPAAPARLIRRDGVLPVRCQGTTKTGESNPQRGLVNQSWQANK